MVNKWFPDRNCEGEHAGLYGHSEMLCAMRGYDEEAQGLVCLLDGNWGSVLERSSFLGCHFGHKSLLEYGSEYVCAELSPALELQGFSRPAKKFYGKSADAEWNWVLHRQQASARDLPSKDTYEENIAIVLGNEVKECVTKGTIELSTISICCAASKTEGCPHVGISKPRRVRMIQSAASNTAVLSRKDSPLWHTHTAKGHSYVENYDLSTLRSSLTWKEEDMEAVLSRIDIPLWHPAKGHAYVENCDLSTLRNSSTWKEESHITSSISVNSCSSPSVDELCLASSLCEGKPSPLENTFSIMSTTIIPHSTPPCGHLSGVTEPCVIQSVPQQPSIHNSFSNEKTNRKASNEECCDATDQEYEVLGKALCHAQTRARLAEKLAAQALQEREKLERLLLREAWTTCTYRQRAQALELENRVLKLSSKMDLEVWAGSESFYPCRLAEQRARTSWKLTQKRRLCQKNMSACVSNSCQDKDCKSCRSQKRSVLLACTLGLAFVLGLSFAGAGFIIGWNMSRIMFS